MRGDIIIATDRDLLIVLIFMLFLLIVGFFVGRNAKDQQGDTREEPHRTDEENDDSA